MENQIVGAILIGTIVILLIISFLIVFIVKTYKYKKMYVEQSKATAKARDAYEREVSTSFKLIETNSASVKLINFLRQQLPLTPVLQSIQYYGERKNVQVHCFITHLGIAVISDIDEMNYKIKLIAELGEPIDTTAEDLVKDLIEDTTPLKLDGSLEEIIANILDIKQSGKAIGLKNAKILIEHRNKIYIDKLVSEYLTDSEWNGLVEMIALDEGTIM